LLTGPGVSVLKIGNLTLISWQQQIPAIREPLGHNINPAHHISQAKRSRSVQTLDVQPGAAHNFLELFALIFIATH
jgi:hypothetical protein